MELAIGGVYLSCFLFFIFYFSFLLLSSCGKSGKNEQNIFRYNEVSGISSLDPAFAKVNLLSGPLTRFTIHWLKQMSSCILFHRWQKAGISVPTG